MMPERNIDWRAMILGTVVAAALGLVLVALGVGLGLATIGTAGDGPPPLPALGLWVLVVGIASAAVGGFIAGRLRREPGSATAHERKVRDRAHGLGMWGLGVLLALAVLTVGPRGPGRGMAGNGGGSERSNFIVDALYRPLVSTPGEAPGASSTGSAMAAAGGGLGGGQSAAQAERAEVARIVRFGVRRGQLSADDRTYVAGLVARSTDRTQGEAERRIDQVLGAAQRRAETGRKTAALVIGMLSAGALLAAVIAAWAATVGGGRRD